MQFPASLISKICNYCSGEREDHEGTNLCRNAERWNGRRRRSGESGLLDNYPESLWRRIHSELKRGTRVRRGRESWTPSHKVDICGTRYPERQKAAEWARERQRERERKRARDNHAETVSRLRASTQNFTSDFESRLVLRDHKYRYNISVEKTVFQRYAYYLWYIQLYTSEIQLAVSSLAELRVSGGNEHMEVTFINRRERNKGYNNLRTLKCMEVVLQGYDSVYLEKLDISKFRKYNRPNRTNENVWTIGHRQKFKRASEPFAKLPLSYIKLWKSF